MIPAQATHLPEEFYNYFLLLTWLLPCNTNNSDIKHKSTTNPLCFAYSFSHFLNWYLSHENHPQFFLLLHNVCYPLTFLVLFAITYSLHVCRHFLSLIHSLIMLSICSFKAISSSLLGLSLQISSWEYQAPSLSASRMWEDMVSCAWSALHSNQWTLAQKYSHGQKAVLEGASLPLRKAGGRDTKQ